MLRILHRDLKSENLLVKSVDRNVKVNVVVTDFNISKIVDRKKKRLTNIVGSIFWTCPEILDSAPYTEKCDIYSLGIIMWELIHRQKPYVGMNWQAEVHKYVVSGGRPKIKPLVKDISTGFIQLMQRCWDEDPDKRPGIEEVAFFIEAEKMRGEAFKRGFVSKDMKIRSRSTGEFRNLISSPQAGEKRNRTTSPEQSKLPIISPKDAA